MNFVANNDGFTSTAYSTRTYPDQAAFAVAHAMTITSTFCYTAIGCLVLAALTGAITGCGSESANAVAATEPGKATGTRERFELAAEAIAKSELGLETAGSQRMHIGFSVPAHILADENHAVRMATPLSGIVREVRKQLGDQVLAGDVLFVIDSRELAHAMSAHVTARAHAELATADQSRASTIADNTNKLLALLAQDGDQEQIEITLKDAAIGDNRAQLLSAYARVRAAKVTYVREKELGEKKISPAADFAMAEEEFAAARAKYTALREEIAYASARSLKEATRLAAQVALNETTTRQELLALGLTSDDITALFSDTTRPFTRYEVKTPIAGTIVERRVSPGQSVTDGQESFYVADLSRVVVEMAVPIDQLALLKTGQKVEVRVPNLAQHAQGQLMYLAPVVDEKSGAALGRVRIANPEGLWRPGMFVTSEFILDETDASIAVLSDAIQIIDGAPVVFVQEGNAFLVHKIKPGRSDATMTELLDGSGIAVGARYVARNSFVLKAHLLSLGGG